MDEARVCAAGREISREDGAAGLDWATPCPDLGVEWLVIKGIGEVWFCVAHWNVVAPALNLAYAMELLIDQDTVGGGPESDADGLTDEEFEDFLARANEGINEAVSEAYSAEEGLARLKANRSKDA
jgi:hypothetical protein